MEDITFFGIKLIDNADFLELVVRFGFNFIVSTILVMHLYYKNSKREQYVFSFILLNTTIFLIIFLLGSVKLKLGFALGLFAIFGIIRYRTNPIPIKEMTYLFAVIGIAVINAMSNAKVSYAELLLTNFLILLVVYVFDRFWLVKQLSVKKIKYEKIDLIQPDKRAALKADLEARTGLEIKRIELGNVNFLNDTAEVLIYYKPIGTTEVLEAGFNDNDDDE